MLLNNPLLDVQYILNELQVKGLKNIRKRIKDNYFDRNMNESEILDTLKTQYFADCPRLKYVLEQIFSESTDFSKLNQYGDWSPTMSFSWFNYYYGYFSTDLTELYNKLSNVCHKMVRLIENQEYFEVIAYKLMVFFYDADKSQIDNFEHIATSFNRFLTVGQDVAIQHPLYDVFVSELYFLPCFPIILGTCENNIPEKDPCFMAWKTFVRGHGVKTLKIFLEASPIREPLQSSQDLDMFLLLKLYLRAAENIELATLCRKMLVSNVGFNAGLDYVQSSWPKKTHDNLPIVQIKYTPEHSNETFYWVKLPPQDMRALYLGNLIPECCQFINGESKQCVKDGIALSDNGFYVLLKTRNRNGHQAPLIENQINDKYYQMVAQSYAWISNHGNLCLDSIEWDPQRVNFTVIHRMMERFSTEVFQQQPNIKYITVGSGGGTPKNAYPKCEISETMRQGMMYGDARIQMKVASRISPEEESQLQERLNAYSEHFKNMVLYIAPYFNDVNVLPQVLIDVNPNIVNELSQKFVRRCLVKFY